ncbi:MAG TPA: SRPBCC domain-containing protein, partial [Alphaproteobacteria bacterium]|nr:SRPBCC domain-containing protein [Alphaproteobacteria bacterium]
MAYEIRTQIIIQSPAAKIWQVLTDFPSYPNWNPFIRSISGSLIVGQPLKVEIQPPGQKSMRFKPQLLSVENNKKLAWKGKVLLPGLLDGEHIFELAPT